MGRERERYRIIRKNRTYTTENETKKIFRDRVGNIREGRPRTLEKGPKGVGGAERLDDY